jgi:hypothetical protein
MFILSIYLIIRLPSSEIVFQNQIVRKYIDTEVMLHMFMENFLNWEFYLINFLISFKEIRSLVDFYSNRKAYKSNQELDLFKENVKYCGDCDKFYSYINTKEDKQNIILKIIPTVLKVDVRDFNLCFMFEFTLKQMRIIGKCNQNSNLDLFFKKILYLTKKNELVLDFEKLENITPTLLKYVVCDMNLKNLKNNWMIDIK